MDPVRLDRADARITLSRIVRDLLPCAVESEHLAHIADDVADGLVLQALRQRPLNPVLQVQVVNLIDLNVIPTRPPVDLCLVFVPERSRGHAVVLDGQPSS